MHFLTTTTATLLAFSAFALPSQEAQSLAERSPTNAANGISISQSSDPVSTFPLLNLVAAQNISSTRIATGPPPNDLISETLLNATASGVECITVGHDVNLAICTPLFEELMAAPSDYRVPQIWGARPGAPIDWTNGGCKIRIHPGTSADIFSYWWIMDAAKQIMRECAGSGLGGMRTVGGYGNVVQVEGTGILGG